MARSRNARRRRSSLERLGVLPRGRLRRAFGPAFTVGDAVVGALFVVALVLALNPRRIAAVLWGSGRSLGQQGGRLWALHVLAGTAVVVVVVGGVGAVLLARFRHRRPGAWRQLAVFVGGGLLCLGLAQVLVALDADVSLRWQSLVYLTPLAGFSILFTVVYGPGRALAATVVLALLLGLIVHAARPGSAAQPLAVVVVHLCGGGVAVLGSTKIRKRLKLFVLGLLVGLTQALLVAGFDLLDGKLRLGAPAPPEALLAFANGLAVGIVMTISLPFVELFFNAATDIRLLELSDQEQPLLRSLVSRAPSTDNHSRRVALLGEAAAESIGANALLTRVAAYYHDIGKLARPSYFIENVSDAESPHDRLRPSMSALIIAAHTRDGVEMAEDAGLPRSIIDIIGQHHGTSVIEFFYQRHLEEADGKSPLGEDFFRYAGPKAATREAAILMLADAVEAASRTLDEPLPARIRALIRKIIVARLADGQLDDCGLTLREIHRVEESFYRVLCAMYHARIDYPDVEPAPTLRGRTERSLAAT